MKVKPCKIRLNGEKVYFEKRYDGKYIISHRYSVDSVEIYPIENHESTKYLYTAVLAENTILWGFFRDVEDYYFTKDVREW